MWIRDLDYQWGGLFAAIGNKYTVDSIVPLTNDLTLIAKLHNLTFMYSFIIIVISVISLKIYQSKEKHSKQQSKKLDKWSFYLIFSSFIVIFLILILSQSHII